MSKGEQRRDWKNGEFYFLFRKYFLGKYMLMEEEAVSDDINELTRISVEKLSSLDKKLIKNVEEAASCDGASSVITKKALFYMVMQKELRDSGRSRIIDECKNHCSTGRNC